ncbi:MAG: 3D domain-containing protein [Bacillota bacterium]
MKNRKTWFVLGGLLVLTLLFVSPLKTHAAGLSRLLMRGDTGGDVQQVQIDLRSLGYGLKADGIFGPITEKTVKSFQVDRGLIVDGIVGPKTARAIDVALGRSGARAANATQVSRGGGVVQTPNGPLNYRSVIDVRATAYDSSWQSNGDWGPVAAWKGLPLRPGMIAVDPRVIPLGTRVFVTGYDNPNLPRGGFVGIAADTGGAIKGNRIDIFMDESTRVVMNFGIQNVQVYILN